MRCSNCKSKLRKGVRFCPRCGTEISNDAKPDVPWKAVIIGLLAMLVVAAAIAVVIFATHKNPSEEDSVAKTDSSATSGIADEKDSVKKNKRKSRDSDKEKPRFLLDNVCYFAIPNIPIDDESIGYDGNPFRYDYYYYGDDGRIVSKESFEKYDDDFRSAGTALCRYESDGSYSECGLDEYGPEIKKYDTDGRLLEDDHYTVMDMMEYLTHSIDRYDENGILIRKDCVNYTMGVPDGIKYECRYEYDEKGRMTYSIEGQWEKRFVYGDNDSLIRREEGPLDEAKDVTEYTYGDNNMLVSARITYGDGRVEDTVFRYGADGKVCGAEGDETQFSIYDPLRKAPRYVFGEDGRMIAYYSAGSETDADYCEFIKYEYDENGYLAKEYRGSTDYDFDQNKYVDRVYCRVDYSYKELPIDSNAEKEQPADYSVNSDNVADYGSDQVLDYSKYNRNGSVYDFVYSYPASLYNSVEVSDDVVNGDTYGTRIRRDYYSGSDGSSALFEMFTLTDTSAEGMAEEMGYDGYVAYIEQLGEYAFNVEYGQIAAPGVVLNAKTKNDNGYIVILTGYTDESEEVSVYDLVRIDSLCNVYHMLIHYPTPHDEEEKKRTDYFIECMYRLCEFSNHQSAPRSFEEFCNSR